MCFPLGLSDLRGELTPASRTSMRTLVSSLTPLQKSWLQKHACDPRSGEVKVDEPLSFAYQSA